MNKKIAVPFLALALAIGASAFVIKTVSAADEQRTSIIQKLATKFGLQEADVGAVFTEHRAEMQKEHEQAFTEKLNQAVTDGKLTTAQKDAILAKHAEMQSMRDAEREDRQQKRTELTQWAEENNIDPSFLFGQMRDESPHMQRMEGGMR